FQGALAFVALLAVSRAHVLVAPHTPFLTPPHFFGATPLGGHGPVLVISHGPGGPPFVPGVFPHGGGPKCTDGKSSEEGGSAKDANEGGDPGFAHGVGIPGQPTFQLVPVFNVHGGPPFLHPVPIDPKGKAGRRKKVDGRSDGPYFVGYLVPPGHGSVGVPFHTAALG
ncbi:unnamed protein product, partial [Ixodes persulcatus]